MKKFVITLVFLFIGALIFNLTLNNFTGNLVSDAGQLDYTLAVGDSIYIGNNTISLVFVNVNLAGNVYGIFNVNDIKKPVREFTLQVGETRNIYGFVIELKKVRPFIINSETRGEAAATLGIKKFEHPNNGRYNLIVGESFILNNNFVKLESVQKTYSTLRINEKTYLLRPNEEKSDQGLKFSLVSSYYNSGLKSYDDPSKALLIILPEN